MEDNRGPSVKKLLSIQEEKLVREVNYVELEILQKNSNSRSSQRVTVSIKPRIPAVKTLYKAEKEHFISEKQKIKKSAIRHARGDHSSLTKYSWNNADVNVSVSLSPDRQSHNKEKESLDASSESVVIGCSPSLSKCSYNCVAQTQTSNECNASGTLEKCFVQNQSIMNPAKVDDLPDMQSPRKIDKATLIVTKPSSEDSLKHSGIAIDQLNKRLEQLERKVLREQTIIYPTGLSSTHSSVIEEPLDDNMKSTSMTGRAGCSYIDQYSHIPGTSAFQRYAQQPPVSLNRGSTGRTQERKSSEQYGRNFTAYDGITSRGRRQCASVPCRRNDVPTMQDRGKNIRHKLNPIHDYRLMDTVHYLAQGEFAPRDDGIKLTTSREAVLSDIIWEDVCRTHWPNARLSRRTTHYDRHSTRSELQKLIDGLLRDRVTHVERKRRRHYKVVRLNHGQTSCRGVGKTGDIIVASHKKPNNIDVAGSERDATCRMATERHRDDQGSRRCRDRPSQEVLLKRKFGPEDYPPGPSHAVVRGPNDVLLSCRHRNANHSKRAQAVDSAVEYVQCTHEYTSSSNSTCNHHVKPRLLVKKDSRRIYHKDNPKMEHYILLPTLVVRTPSNLKRQKKFNELYHRIQVKSKDSDADNEENNDVGTNFNIAPTESEESSKKKNR